MATPSSGLITIGSINQQFGWGNDLNSYRGRRWYTPNSLTTGLFPSGAISLSDFYNKQPNDPATSGVLDYQSPGYYTIAIPLYRNYFRVQCWGAGGGGGAGSGGAGNTGGNSTILGVTGYGGQGGQPGPGYRSIGAAGAGGGAGGGNEVNGAGASGNSYDGGAGYAGGGGGGGNTGLNSPGNGGGYPGGGGGGGQYDNYKGWWQVGGGGGGGGYAQTVWGPGALGAGAVVGLYVGAGGAGGGGTANGGNGGNGRVYISWG